MLKQRDKKILEESRCGNVNVRYVGMRLKALTRIKMVVCNSER